MEKKLQIIYEDPDIVVCHKGAGIPVQTSKPGQQDMVSLLRNYFARKKENTEIFLVHRLDQPVEGVMVFARTKKAAAELSRQVKEKNMDKYYFAVVQGILEKQSGTLEHYLLREGKTNTSRVVTKETPGAKKAVLSYEVKEVFREYSLVQIKLETGRHHQIRVQMAEMGHPLVGDKKYNWQCQAGYQPIGLCSVRTAFLHPKTGKFMEFSVTPQGIVFKNILENAE